MVRLSKTIGESRSLFKLKFKLRITANIFQVSLPCEEMLLTCDYGGIEYNCMDIFVTVLTDEGLCCTFNNQIIHSQKFTAQNKLKLRFFLPTTNLNHRKDSFFSRKQFRFSSNTTELEFNVSESISAHANDWTPENGFGSEEIGKNSWPRAGAGKHLAMIVFSRHSYVLK